MPPAAQDSPRRLFAYFCLACWLIWLPVAGLGVWALYMAEAGGMPFERPQVLRAVWWTTYFCVGLPLAVRLAMYWIERHDLSED